MKQFLKNMILVMSVLVGGCALLGVLTCVVFLIGSLIFDQHESVIRWLIGLVGCIVCTSIFIPLASACATESEPDIIPLTENKEPEEKQPRETINDSPSENIPDDELRLFEICRDDDIDDFD